MFGSMVDDMRGLPPATFLRAIPYALVTAVLIGVPADLIDTPIFGRPVESRPIDYVLLAITSALIGLVFAIRVPAALTDDQVESSERNETRTMWGGGLSFLAVGCPVCNQAVVALLGTSGALSWWAPIQPVVGLLAIAVVLWALRERLRTYQLIACPIPAQPTEPAV